MSSTMLSSPLPSSTSLQSVPALAPPPQQQPVHMLSTAARERKIQADIVEFWSSFPCPPPWKPHLLVEVNASRLEPHISRTLQSFLAGKCDIRHVLSDSDKDFNFDSSDFGHDFDFPATPAPDPGSSFGDPSTSHQQWCDTTCLLSFGCAVFFVVVVMAVAVMVCVSKNRIRHKMAATRPSRQPLQLSTSTSDAANCADFSNLEISGEDDIICPPFRHRGLPNPPGSCYPSCDPKWNCPNCSSCHPLMPVNPPEQYYSRAYSAVYETIDDVDEDEFQLTDNENQQQQSREITTVMSELDEAHASCSACQISPEAQPLRPSLVDDKKESHKVAETRFNGDEHYENVPRSSLDKYFKLEQSCALRIPIESNTSHHQLMNFSNHGDTPSQLHNIVFPGRGQSESTSVAHERQILAGTPLHSFVISQAQHCALPSASDLYKVRSSAEPSAPSISKDFNKDLSQNPDIEPHVYRSGYSERFNIPVLNGHTRCSSSDQVCHSRQQKECPFGKYDPNHVPYNVSACSKASSFVSDGPCHCFCSTFQHSDTAYFSKLPAANATSPQQQQQQQLSQRQGSKFLPGNADPDLINEAANYSRNMEGDTCSPGDTDSKNSEAQSSQKTALALHSHYFPKP